MLISVYMQQEKMVFRLVTSFRQKKFLSPYEELNLRPTHSVLHRSAESEGGVIRRK